MRLTALYCTHGPRQPLAGGWIELHVLVPSSRCLVLSLFLVLDFSIQCHACTNRRHLPLRIGCVTEAAKGRAKLSIKRRQNRHASLFSRYVSFLKPQTHRQPGQRSLCIALHEASPSPLTSSARVFPASQIRPMDDAMSAPTVISTNPVGHATVALLHSLHPSHPHQCRARQRTSLLAHRLRSQANSPPHWEPGTSSRAPLRAMCDDKRERVEMDPVTVTTGAWAGAKPRQELHRGITV
ncbi:hypothetical protein LZ30DRAFT_357523 [Colletotrichum cereale]|nr:hypothetical protein LZ30DRAFT_357523 [Colletotrichum cereale]